MASKQYQRYGDYIVNRKQPLGQGKFGTVWRGYRIVRGQQEENEYLQPVAIKQSCYDQQNIQQISTLQILNHPSIIRYIDYKISGQNLFMVMELCEGGTLQDLLMEFQEDNLTAQVLNYYSQIVRGIRFMYEKNILHRDIKPSNILLKDNRIKIADFGTSKMKQGNQMIKTLVGTPLFASPEILQLFVGDEQSYTEKSDIWSLGLILYFMFHYQKHHESALTRLKESLPWKGKNAIQVLNNIKTKPLQFHCKSISEEIKEIISKMLTIDVQKRMSFKQFFQIKLFQGQVHKKPTQVQLQTSLMGQSIVNIDLSESYDYDEYELTLLNECTHQPLFLKRETIDFELLKLIEIRDSQDYEDKQIYDAIKFYELIREEAQFAESKDNYNDLIFEVDCQIYQLLIFKRFFLRKIVHSQKGIRKTHFQERKNIIPSLLNNEEQPEDESQAIIFRKCRVIRERYFAYSRRFQQINQKLKTIFQQLLQNSNIVEKEKLMMQIICPHQFLKPQIKLILSKKKALFQQNKQKINSIMSNSQIYLCYDLISALAFQFCWKQRTLSKRRLEMNLDFYDNYKMQRSKISIWQIINRSEQGLKVVKFQ